MKIYAPVAAAALPSGAGAYALLIRLELRFCDRVGALGPVGLAPGAYLYCGSANGAGGLHARIARHLRAEKIAHWHVDRLTQRGIVAAVMAAPGGSECGLVSQALAIPGVTAPLTGFGSSDCRRCSAHLLRLPGDGAAAFEALLA